MASSAPQTMGPSQAPKRKSANVGWEFGYLADPDHVDKVKCNICGKIMSGGVNRLKQHVAGITGQVTPCTMSTAEQKLKCRNALNEFKIKKKNKEAEDEALRSEVNIGSNEPVDLEEMEYSFGNMKPPTHFGPIDKFAQFEDPLDKGKNKQSTLSNVILKEKMIKVKEYICRWANECGVPFHAFERDSFKTLLEAVGQFGPRALPPNRYELGDTYLKKEVDRTKSLLKRYEEEWELTGCSIMTDAWCDRKRRSIMNLCVNSKLGTVFLSSKESSNEAHTSAHIFEYVDSCIETVGPEKVVQVVTDNAANNMGAATLLKEKRPTIFWTSCATHTINLMLEAIGGLTRFKKTLDQAKKLTIFIYAHHKTLALMRHFTKKRDIVRPGVTRFASAFLTLQSLNKKKSELRHMFSSDEWEKCKFSKTVKGKAAYATVVATSFWNGVSLCLKVFAPLVKVLRMVDADWKPSMGFIYGELEKAKKEIQDAVNNNERAYSPILNIISTRSAGRLDTPLHIAAYALNPYYLYNDLEVQKDDNVNEAVVDLVGILFGEDYDMQNEITLREFPMYKGKLEKFGRAVAISGCAVNDEKFDPALWWSMYGGSTPNLKKIAMRILSLTTSSSGCERNWSTFEGVHTKKRNRLDAARMNNLVYVQFNTNLMEKNKKRKARDHEVLLAQEASEAQEWIVEGDVYADVSESGLPRETVRDDMGADELLGTRTSTRSNSRELYEEEFESESEVEVDEEIEYESDGVEIIEQYGQDEDGTSI